MTHPFSLLTTDLIKKIQTLATETPFSESRSTAIDSVRAVEDNSSRLQILINDSATRLKSTPTPTLSPAELAAMIDHTLLKAETTSADLHRICEEARAQKFATVCVNSSFIPLACELLNGSDVKPIAVVGFPLGACTSSVKAFEAAESIENGAREIDMVLPVGALKAKDYAYVFNDISLAVEVSKPYPVKVILETALLSTAQKAIACMLAKAAGAAFVKTSTGFAATGATVEDIALMRQVVGPDIGVKASGGIRTLEDALKMIQAGASRIGASASVSIIEQASGKIAGGSTETDRGY